MKKCTALVIALMLALLLCTPALALKVVEPGEDFYYLDQANVLSEEAEGTIFFANQKLQAACGAEIVVAALNTVGGEDIYDYALEMFNEWGIGSPEENNGLLILLAIRDENYYVLAGGGVDRLFSPAETGRLIDKHLEPGFADAEYEEAVLEFFGAALDRYADYYNLDISIEDGRAGYEAYVSGNEAQYDGNAVRSRDYDSGRAPRVDVREFEREQRSASRTISGAAVLVIIVVVVVLLSSRRRIRRSGAGRPVFTRVHHHPRPPRPPMHRPMVRTGFSMRSRPSGRSGFTGSGRSSGRSFSGSGRSSSRSSGFGGSSGGGGRSFGGGAGRGRR